MKTNIQSLNPNLDRLNRKLLLQRINADVVTQIDSNNISDILKELRNLAASPLVVPDDSCSHTQPVERLIKKLTKVSEIVFSPDRREQYVRAQEKSSAPIREGKTKEIFGILSLKLLTFHLLITTIAGMLHIGQ